MNASGAVRGLWLLGAAALLGGGAPAPASGGFTKVKLGEGFPELTGRDARGADVTLAEYREAPLLLAFVRPDQEFSLRVLRDLQAISPEVEQAGAKIVVVAATPDDARWPEILEQNEITLRVLFDEGGRSARACGLVAHPTTAILSRGSVLTRAFLLHEFDYQKRVLDEVLGLLELRGGTLTEEELAARRREEAFDAARREEREGRYARALELYREIAAADPAPFRAQLARGTLLLRLGRDSEAVEPLFAARAAHPQSAKAVRGLGLAYAGCGEDVLARALLEQAVAIDPDPGPVHRQLSRIYLEAGELDRALEHARKALAAVERRSR